MAESNFKRGPCVNHPDKPAHARGLCQCCYTRQYYHSNPAYREATMARAREWDRENRDRKNAQVRARRASTKVNAREYHLRHKYGIGLVEFDRLLESQDGKCALCRMPPKEGGAGLHVDHCHTTGRVRGLLCHQCNWYLGKVDRDPAILERMRLYRDPHSSDVQHAQRLEAAV